MPVDCAVLIHPTFWPSWALQDAELRAPITLRSLYRPHDCHCIDIQVVRFKYNMQALHSTPCGVSHWRSTSCPVPAAHVAYCHNCCGAVRTERQAATNVASQWHMPARRRVWAQAAIKGFGFGGQKADKQCPCGSGQEYSTCCQRYHKTAVLKAPTAEAVLRARFSAYAKRDWKYIMRTTHPDNTARRGSVSNDGTVRTTFEEDIKVSMYNFDFKQLRMVGTTAGSNASETVIDMEVDLVQHIDEKAKKLDKPTPQTLRERALFVQDGDGEWQFRQLVDSNWSREELKVVS